MSIYRTFFLHFPYTLRTCVLPPNQHTLHTEPLFLRITSIEYTSSLFIFAGSLMWTERRFSNLQTDNASSLCVPKPFLCWSGCIFVVIISLKDYSLSRKLNYGFPTTAQGSNCSFNDSWSWDTAYCGLLSEIFLFLDRCFCCYGGDIEKLTLTHDCLIIAAPDIQNVLLCPCLCFMLLLGTCVF